MNPDDVLRVAMKAYWQEGPKVSVNAICHRAGISKPSLYRDFGGEDELTTAALEHYAGMLQRQLKDLLSSERSFADKLEAIITLVSEDPRHETGCLFVKMRAARRDLGPKTRAKIAEIETATLKLYARFFRESRKAGAWPGHLSPDFAAQYLHAQIGLAVSQRALGAESATVRSLLACALSVLLEP